MNVLDSSLAYRFAAWVVNGFMVSGRDSLAGRFLIAFAQGISRACAGSVSLGLRRAGARPLTRSGHPVVLLVIVRPYLWLRGVLAPVAAYGRLRVGESRFARGNWLVVVGAGAFALGCGRLSGVFREGVTAGGVVVVVILVAGGALLAVSAPRLVSALNSSLLVRGTRRLAMAVVQGGPKGALADAGPASAGGPGTASTGESVPRTAAAARRINRDPLLLASIGLALAAGLAGGISTSVGPAPIVAAGAVIILAALVLHRPEVFFLVGAAFPWVDWAARHSLGGLGAAWDDAFLLLSIALLVWAVLFLRRAELWTVPVLLPLILAFVAAIGSVVVNRVPGNVGIFALRVLFQPILFYLLGFLFPKNKRWIQWAVSLFIVASVAMALHGLYQYVTHAPMPASWIDVHEGDISTRAYSIVENPNGLGAFLLLGTLLTLSLALRSRLRPIQRWTMALACVVLTAGVAVTFSRGAWLGLGAGVVALFVMSYRRYLVPLAAAGIVGWFVLPTSFTNRLTFAFSSTYLAKSLTAGRLYVWRIAFYDIVSHPLLGVGLGTFGGTTAVTFGYTRLWVDNFYLQVAAEGGLILFALFLWVLLRTAKGLVKGHSLVRDPYMRALTAGVFGGFIAVAVANLTASVWETLVVGVGFWFLAGMATSAAFQIRGDASAEDRG